MFSIRNTRQLALQHVLVLLQGLMRKKAYWHMKLPNLYVQPDPQPAAAKYHWTVMLLQGLLNQKDCLHVLPAPTAQPGFPGCHRSGLRCCCRS